MQPHFNNRNLPRRTQPMGRSAAHQPTDGPSDTQPAHWYAGDSPIGRGGDMAAGHSTFSRPTSSEINEDEDAMTTRERQERDKKFNKGSLQSRRFMGPGAW